MRVCVEKCLCQGKHQMSRNIVVMWDFLLVSVAHHLHMSRHSLNDEPVA